MISFLHGALLTPLGFIAHSKTSLKLKRSRKNSDKFPFSLLTYSSSRPLSSLTFCFRFLTLPATRCPLAFLPPSTASFESFSLLRADFGTRPGGEIKVDWTTLKFKVKEENCENIWWKFPAHATSNSLWLNNLISGHIFDGVHQEPSVDILQVISLMFRDSWCEMPTQQRSISLCIKFGDLFKTRLLLVYQKFVNCRRNFTIHRVW